MRIKVFISLLLLSALVLKGIAQTGPARYSGEIFTSLDKGIEGRVNVTVIYDNYVFTEGLEADWGFSLLLEGLDKTILFDTGTKPTIFRKNFEKLKLDPAKINEVFISHEHGDHFGGLHEFLTMNSEVKLVVPNTFSKRFINQYKGECKSIETVSGPAEICPGLYTTGVQGIAIPEQSLVLNTGKGLVVITGCSHPGIIDMLESIKVSFGKNIYMVFGGFHLMNASDGEIDIIIRQMRELGVQKCGATHCTGERQIELFRKAFGKDFVEMGAGNIVSLL